MTIFNALLAAMSAKSQVDSLVTMRLSLIPVREVIHSSEVSSVLDKSSLVTIFGGKLPK
jgi:uridylate kinase